MVKLKKKYFADKAAFKLWQNSRIVKWCLHYGDNHSKLGLFKNAKNIFLFLKMH
jgi:hypothetical protein